MRLIRLAAYAISAFVVGSAIKAFADLRRTQAASPRNTRSSRARSTRAGKARATRPASEGKARADSQSTSTVHARSHAPAIRSH